MSFIIENWMLFALAIASGALLLWPSLNAGAGQNALAPSAVVQMIKNKKLPVVLVCASGARSHRAVATAKKLGFERAYSLVGGMGAWREASLPVETT